MAMIGLELLGRVCAMVPSLEWNLRRAYTYLHRTSNVPLLENVSYGEDFPDKTFLVIRRNSPDCAGLLSFFNTNRTWIHYAIKNGTIPIVDMQTHLNQLLEVWEVGRKNAWEYYFEQPMGYSLHDIAHAKNVIIAHAINPPDNTKAADWMSSPAQTEEMRSFVGKYLRIKHNALHEFDNPELETALKNPEELVIGLLARGTDYNATKPHGHHVQPNPDDFISAISHYPPTAKIYLVTEDITNQQRICAAFGDRVILSKQQLPSYRKGLIAAARCPSLSRQQQGAGYLKAIYDLSRCPILISGYNNGYVTATLLSSGFKKIHLIDKGCYTKIRRTNNRA